MATSPRPGVIQLDHPNVYMAAKEAQKDNWIRQGLDIFGNAIQERNRDIRYRRALAKAQGLEEPDETTIGDLASSAGSKIAEGASWLKDKWDRLDIRSPFEETLTESDKTETPILETPSEKGSREMIGYTPNPSPIVEQDKYRTQLKAPDRRVVEPNDELSFGINIDAEEKPSPIIPFRTGEQIPEQIGTKVDFGTSEPTIKLRSPFAMRTKEEMEAQKPVSPVAGAANDNVPEGMLRAPDWSEMFRLDPKRAEYDWNREKAQQKTELDMLKALGTDSNLDDIRAIHNAYINQKTALYNQGFDDTDPRVKIADSYIKYTGDLLAEKGLLPKSSEVNTDNVNGATFETDKTKLDSAISKGRKAIGSAIDKDGDGVVDNANEIRQKLNDVLREYNINPNSKEWKATLGEWDSMVDDIGKKASEAMRKKERAQDKATEEKDKKLQQEDKYEWLYVAYTDLKNNPNDVSSKAYATQAALRKESGAAIAQDEFLQAMGKLLPSDKYNELIKELGGLGGLAANLTGQKETYLSNVLARYMQYADSGKILNTYLGPKIEPYYKYKELKKKSQVDGGGGGGKFSKYGKK